MLLTFRAVSVRFSQAAEESCRKNTGSNTYTTVHVKRLRGSAHVRNAEIEVKITPHYFSLFTELDVMHRIVSSPLGPQLCGSLPQLVRFLKNVRMRIQQLVCCRILKG